MTLLNYKGANNAQSGLLTSINAAATTLSLSTGKGALFPATFPYLVTLEQVADITANPLVVDKREIVKVTNRVGDVLTIVRSAGSCPVSDAASAQTTTAQSFTAALTIVSLYMNNEMYADLVAELERLETAKLSISDYQAANKIYGASSSGTDAYAVTPTPAWTSYTNGASFRFLSDVGNTGAATLNISGLGAITIKKLHDQDLATGDIEANQIVEVVYYGGTFQMVSQVALIADVSVTSFTDQSFWTGENLTAGNPVFVESLSTMAAATTVYNIGDIAANTRIAFPVLGSGTAFTTLKLSLKKFVSPSASLSVRIETNGSSAPSGTAVTNGTATVTAASLTTSLADTTVTMAGSVTLTEGTLYWVVLNIVGDVVNGTNYYGIGFNPNNSTIRNPKPYDGSSWASGTPTVDATNLTYASDSNGQARGAKFVANATTVISGVTYPSGFGTATRCFIENSAGTVLATSTTFVGRTAIFSPTVAITNGTTYRAEFDAGGGAYNYGYFTFVSNIVRTNVTYTGGSAGGADHSNINMVESITTGAGLTQALPYIYSTGILDGILGKASALYSYKANIFGTCAETVAVGANKAKVTLPKGGFDNNQSGLTPATPYYLSDTAGAISTTAGTNKVKIGDALTATKLLLDKKLLYTFSITTPASGTAWQNTTGLPIEVSVTGGTVSIIAISKDGTTYFTKYTATANSVILQPLDYIKVTWSGSPTLTGNYI